MCYHVRRFCLRTLERPAVKMQPPERFPSPFLLLILLVYAVLAVGYAVRTPVWQAPDEPAHYNYIAQVAQRGCCPVIELGDWDQTYLDELKSSRFAPERLDELDTVQYEDHQPPLYYLLASPVYSLTGGSLTALRLLSVLYGAGVVVCAYGVASALLPNRRAVALAAAAFVALLPQHLSVLASVNNDSLAELIVGVTLWLLILLIKGRDVPVWLLGVLVGIGLLTKVNTIFLVGLVPVGLFLRWWPVRGRLGVATLVRALVLFAIPALLLAGVWWARNISTYGWPDIFGLGAHDAVVVGQGRTANYLAAEGWGAYLSLALRETYNSFWGQFGWMSTPLQPWMYAGLTALLGVAGVGLLLGLRRGRLAPASTAQRSAWAVLLLALIVAFAQFVYYNTEFLQFQGRYLYPGLIPFALLVALGLDNWRQLLAGERVGWLAPAVVLLLAPFNVYLLWRVIPLLNP
jgi:4-amino-4-deoxy-L-arabinose transferase-like glycosyltransferase